MILNFFLFSLILLFIFDLCVCCPFLRIRIHIWKQFVMCKSDLKQVSKCTQVFALVCVTPSIFFQLFISSSCYCRSIHIVMLFIYVVYDYFICVYPQCTAFYCFVFVKTFLLDCFYICVSNHPHPLPLKLSAAHSMCLL